MTSVCVTEHARGVLTDAPTQPEPALWSWSLAGETLTMATGGVATEYAR